MADAVKQFGLAINTKETKEMDIRKQIDKDGGVTPFSKKWGIPLNTVKKWNSGHASPPTWVPELFEKARKGEK
jgi:hypothetical protein